MILFIVLFLITGLYLYLRFRPLRSQLNRLPHEPEVNLIFGNVSLFDKKPKGQTMGEKVIIDLWKMLDKDEYQKNGICTYWLGPTPMVIFTQPQYVEQLLASNSLIDKGFQYDFLHRWMGLGLLNSTGDKWRGRRKMLTPSFHFKILEDFIPIMNSKTRILHQIIDRQLKENKGVVTDTSKLFLLCALDIICQSAMGCDINAQSDPNSAYVKATHEMGLMMMDRIVNPFLHNEAIYRLTPTGKKEEKNLKILHKFTMEVITRRKKELKQLMDKGINPETEDDMGRKRKLAFMDSLITEHLKNPSFTVEDIREEVDTFMFEGHDTTGWGVTWATFIIGHYPEVQVKIHEEMDIIFGSDLDREITMDDLREMRYLEMCIKEAQRVYPSVPFVIRKLNEDLVVKVKGEDITIPAGIEIAPFIYNLHRNKYLWSNPKTFDPERFSVENSKNRNPFSYIPFSAGPRNCVGQKFAILEEKAFLASIFRRFKVTSLVQEDEVELVSAMILRSKTPLKTKFELRE